MTLLMKLIYTFLSAYVSFIIIDVNPISFIFIVSILVASINLYLVERLTLPSLGLKMSCITEGIVAAIFSYIIDLFSYSYTTSYTGLIIFSGSTLIINYLFHVYIIKDIEVSNDDFTIKPPIE